MSTKGETGSKKETDLREEHPLKGQFQKEGSGDVHLDPSGICAKLLAFASLIFTHKLGR